MDAAAGRDGIAATGAVAPSADGMAAPPGGPLRIGRRWWVGPPGARPPAEPGIRPIRLAPSAAFGSGSHPTTQICLLALERLVRPGMPVLDLGTGTGILAIAAAQLGAGPVLALDIDPVAVQAARENVALNGLAGSIQVAQGSLGDALSTAPGPAEWPLVVVNILAGVILAGFEQGLGQAVPPGGWLLLSGFLTAQSPGLRAHLRWQGLTLMAQETRGDWAGIIARRDGETARA